MDSSAQEHLPYWYLVRGRLPGLPQESESGGRSSVREDVLGDAALPLHTAMVSRSRLVIYPRAGYPASTVEPLYKGHSE